MQIEINGKAEQLMDGVTLHELITAKGLDPASVVAELNRDIVAGDRFPATKLRDGDHLELLQFVGGG